MGRSTRTIAREREALHNRKWYIFKWEIMIVIGLAFFASLLNVIPNWIVKPLGDGTIDPLLSFPLRDNIIYTSISLFITIGVSIFIGVYTEIGRFAGKYGSAIFVLVPSFVWLLSDRGDNDILHITNMSKILGTSIFYSMIALASVFIILTVIKIYWKNKYMSSTVRARAEFIYNYINRMLIVLTNILIVLMLGYSLINYGILTLHLADITPEMKALDPNLKESLYNLHSEDFTTFIATIAMFFAILMVSIGLSNTFTSKKIVAIDEKELEENPDEISIKDIEEKSEHVLDDTKEVDDE